MTNPGDGIQDEIRPRPAPTGGSSPDGLPVITPSQGMVTPASPPPAPRGGLDRAAGSAPIARQGDGGSDSSLVGVFGDVERAGHWRVPQHLRAFALFGDLNLDLREADLPSGEVVVEVFALCGDVRIIVPPGMEVQTEGFSVLGSTKVESGVGSDYRGPTLVVRRSGVFADLKVRAFAPGEVPPKRWRWF